MNDNKRWGYLIAGTVMLLCLGLIYAWSIFKIPINEIYPEWSLSQLSITFTISIICFVLGGIVGGKLLFKFSSRAVVLISGALIFCGFFGVSSLDNFSSGTGLILLYIFYGILGGLGVGIGYNGIISSVGKWFPDKQGFCSGVLLMGFGFGGIVLGGLVSALIGEMGLFSTFRALSIGIAVIMILGSFFIKKPETSQAKAVGGGKDYTVGEMIKTSAFWIFFIWLILVNSTAMIVINSAASIAVAFGAPAVLGLLVSVFNGAGRVLWGAIFDKKGRKLTMTLIVLVVIVAGILLTIGAKVFAASIVLVGMILVGISYGGSPTISAAFINKAYGAKNFPLNFSIINCSLIPAALIGPIVSSFLIEKSGGNYNTTFVMVIVLGVVAFISGIILNQSAKRL